VEAGLGATAISASVAAPSLEAGLLRRLPLDLPPRDFYVVQNVQRYHSKASEALRSMVTAPFPGTPTQRLPVRRVIKPVGTAPSSVGPGGPNLQEDR
jgi:hypothetical protein